MHQLAVCESLWKMFCLSTLKMWKKEILDICNSKLLMAVSRCFITCKILVGVFGGYVFSGIETERGSE